MNRLSVFLIGLLSFLWACQKPSDLQNYDLRCEAKINPVGIATDQPRFSWKNKSTSQSEQRAYQILVASKPELLEEGKADLWDSEKVFSKESVWIPYAGKKLLSGAPGYWKLMVWDDNEKSTPWSEVQSFSTGLLHKNDWKANYIGYDGENSNLVLPFFRRTFDFNGSAEELFMHVNSLGYHELYINNKKVGDAVLAPAESQFEKRSFSLTYDVSSYLKPGKNSIVLWLGHGWYKHFKERAHNGPLVKAQLESWKNNKKEIILLTDEKWKVRESQYEIWDISKFGGETMDANKIIPDYSSPEFDDGSWENATTFEVPEHDVTPQVVELNRRQKEIKPVEITQLEEGVYLVDMGLNFTGLVDIQFGNLPKGHEVMLQYSDFIYARNEALFEIQSDKPGWRKPVRRNNLFNSQRDRYISDGGPGNFTNKFNYRAFRFLRISNLPEAPSKESITGYLVHTDFAETSSFTCSDPMLNEIHDMFVHTMKCLTIGGKMVDCPHYERLGYGGDGNASTVPAQTVFDLSPLYTTWLTHWADCNGEDGDMPHTAPTYWSSGGGPYWCTFIVKASWQTYLNYGNKRILEQFYPTMLNWLKYIQKYSPNILLEEYPTTENRNWYLGDWATPEDINQRDPQSVGLVTNCAIVDSYEKMIKIAGVLGKNDDVKQFQQKKKELSEAIHATFYHPESATYGTGVQVDLAYPLILGIVPDSLVEKVTESLHKEVLQTRKGHLSTGLVGLPVLTHWVNTSEESELMYTMMKQKDYPGYGYMLENGATTVWEHWRGERSRIHNCYNAPASWFYQGIGGIRPMEEFPGYKRFILAPRPPKQLTSAKVSKETLYGLILVEWSKSGDEFSMHVEVPSGSMAKLVLPENLTTCTINNEAKQADNEGVVWLKAGEYDIVY